MGTILNPWLDKELPNEVRVTTHHDNSAMYITFSISYYFNVLQHGIHFPVHITAKRVLSPNPNQKKQFQLQKVKINEG
jgi:hypothetical protein